LLYKKGRVEFEYDAASKNLENVFVDDREIIGLVTMHLLASREVVKDPFDAASKEINLHPFLFDICSAIFHAVKDVKAMEKDEWMAALLASRLFEGFTVYWEYDLLAKGKDVLGISMWKKVLEHTQKWEVSNKTCIHKGTPLSFLAQNYFLIGDRDLAYLYLYNALVDDKALGDLVPSSGYPFKAPAYFNATMRAEKANHMYPLVERLRKHLDVYIRKFQTDFHASFSILDFDKKFLDDKVLVDKVAFFVYNWNFIVTLAENAKYQYPDTDFSRLRVLDAVFNLCLIIDEVLKEVDIRTNSTIANPHHISHGIIAINNKYGWMSQTDLESFWGASCLNVKNAPPDTLVPTLLDMKVQHNGNPVRQEIFPLLLAYNLRNYGGHNIKQQSVLTKEYERIISQLLAALFLAVQALP
jgi:hypothetical protein